MFGDSSVVCFPNARLDNLVVLCCTDVSHSATPIRMVAVASNGTVAVHLVGTCDEETTLLVWVQAYLACRAAGCRPSQLLERAWHAFYAQCERLARRMVGGGFGDLRVADREDCVQDALTELVAKLPRLVIYHNRGRPFSWIVRVVWRAIRKSVFRHERYLMRHPPLRDDLAESLPCPHPGPEELCIVSETCRQIGSALRRLKAQTSPTTYEIFCRRFLGRQTAHQVAAALGLTARKVHLRYDRVKQKWRKLMREQVLLE